MRRLFRLGVPAATLVVAVVVVTNPGSYLDKVLAQVAGFLETFDGTPAAPAAYTNPNNWDILSSGFNAQETNVAQHGPDCGTPGFPYTDTNSHLMSSPADMVFICNGHLMTSVGLTGYGAVYMMPPALMDFRSGTATLRWDMSTLRTASRDWVDVVLTPYAERQIFAYNNNDQHVPPDNIHIQVAGGGNVWLVSQRVAGGVDVAVPGDGGTTWDLVQAAQNPPLTESAARRDTFQVELTSTHIRVCITGNNTGQTYSYRGQQGFCWVDANLPTPLASSVWGGQSTVQLDHRSYNPEKSCTDTVDAVGLPHDAFGDLHCPPDTWHWDNVFISPAVPYSVIKPTQDFHLTNPSPQRVTFTAAAPPNTNLEFLTFGTNSALQVSFDNGASWQNARFQPSLATGHDENGEVVFMPVPAGITSVMVRGAYGFWGGYDSVGFKLISATPDVVRTIPTATPTAISITGGVGGALATPTPTSAAARAPVPPTSTSTPTATPTATATSTPTNTPTPTPTPLSSLRLNGTTAAFAEAAPSTALNITGNWTIEAWFKDTDPAGYTHDYRSIVDKGDGVSAEAPYFLLVGTGHLLGGVRTGGVNYSVTYDMTGAHVPSGVWQHAAASFDASTRQLTLYLNGTRVARGTLTASSRTGNALPLEIGRHGPTTGKNWLGLIDDLRIWNVVRSATDIQSNFGREFSTAPAGLVANWEFNGLSAGSLRDLVTGAPAAVPGSGATLSLDVHP